MVVFEIGIVFGFFLGLMFVLGIGLIAIGVKKQRKAEVAIMRELLNQKWDKAGDYYEIMVEDFYKLRGF